MCTNHVPPPRTAVDEGRFTDESSGEEAIAAYQEWRRRVLPDGKKNAAHPPEN
jgi:hypothetical protein